MKSQHVEHSVHSNIQHSEKEEEEGRGRDGERKYIHTSEESHDSSHITFIKTLVDKLTHGVFTCANWRSRKLISSGSTW